MGHLANGMAQKLAKLVVDKIYPMMAPSGCFFFGSCSFAFGYLAFIPVRIFVWTFAPLNIIFIFAKKKKKKSYSMLGLIVVLFILFFF